MGASACFGTTIPKEETNTSFHKPEILKKYKFSHNLASGATCKVVGASHKEHIEDQVAIKIMDKARYVTHKLYHQEINILQKLTPNISKPPNGIVPFLSHGEDNDAYYIVTQLMSGGELFDRIISKDAEYRITEKIAVKLVLNMLKAVKYCHDNNVIHRDLKPENFVFTDKTVDSDMVLIDFGCAQIVADDDVIPDMAGTPYYLAPELAAFALENDRKKGRSVSCKVDAAKARTGRILKASDIWAIGVIAFVMMTGRAPFRGKNNIQIYESTCLKPLVFPQKDARYNDKLHLSDDLKDFMHKILNKDPLQRISIEDAIRHPWLQSVDDYLVFEGCPQYEAMNIRRFR